MQVGLAHEIFFVLLAALTGGLLVRLLKLQPIIGYIIGGVVFGSILQIKTGQIEKMAELGAVLLLFSTGIELSLNKLSKVAKLAVFGGLLQIVLVTGLIYLCLIPFGFSGLKPLILAFGFSLSSTAVVVKILEEKSEMNTLHGEIMIGWLLVQDLAVIPMMVLLPVLAGGGSAVFMPSAIALLKAVAVVVGTLVLGKFIAPLFIHKIASINSRELLILAAVTLAIGTASLTSWLGVSAALGAFLAGVVISESQENHAIFSETRPLRDLFVALFFVTLGFYVTPQVIFSNFFLIIGLAAAVIILKIIITFVIVLLFGKHGKTALTVSMGLSNVGEFAFVIFSMALVTKVFTPELASAGIASALLTLIVTPMLFRSVSPIWKKLRDSAGKSKLIDWLVVGGDRILGTKYEYANHIIICGYGRVGGWVGKALDQMRIPFVVVDYNQEVINSLKKKGIEAIYGDPTENEVLEAAGIKDARFVILAFPDAFSQEEIVTRVQKINPKCKIISRVHKDEDYDSMKLLKVEKLIQPEFEGALSIIRSILSSMGKTKDEINDKTKRLRMAHAQI
jgi:CPA2 family monovalent cation:H+ antiporter-2